MEPPSLWHLWFTSMAICSPCLGAKFVWVFSSGYGLTEMAFTTYSLMAENPGKRPLAAWLALFTYLGHGLHMFVYLTGRNCNFWGRGSEAFKDVVHYDKPKDPEGRPRVVPRAVRAVIMTAVSCVYVAHYQTVRFAWHQPEVFVQRSAPARRAAGGLGALGLLGVAFNVAADWQKNFAKGKDADKTPTTGLYALCVYPNYFGECVARVSLGLLAPFFMTLEQWPYMLAGFGANAVFSVKVILDAMSRGEKSKEARFGETQAWKDYRARTKKLVPFVW